MNAIKHTQALTMITSVVCLLLAITLVVTLRVTPADVLRQQLKSDTKTTILVDSLDIRIRQIQEELNRRSVWMDSQNQKWIEVELKTLDRVYRHEIQNVLTELRKNPELNVPELDEDPSRSIETLIKHMQYKQDLELIRFSQNPEILSIAVENAKRRLSK